MCSKQLECFRISSGTMSLGSGNPNLGQYRPILGKITFSKKHQLVPICSRSAELDLMKSFFSSIYFRKSFQNLYSNSNARTINISVKKASVQLSYGKMYLDICSRTVSLRLEDTDALKCSCEIFFFPYVSYFHHALKTVGTTLAGGGNNEILF